MTSDVTERRLERAHFELKRWWKAEQDSWPELKPLYRRKLRAGMVGSRMSRLTGFNGRTWLGRGVKPTKIVAVLRPNGTLVDAGDYSLTEFRNGNYDRRLMFWRVPTMTAGLTVLFEAD